LGLGGLLLLSKLRLDLSLGLSWRLLVGRLLLSLLFSWLLLDWLM